MDNTRSNSPMCVICGKTQSAYKKDAIRRHYETNHPNWSDNYPVGSSARKQKYESLHTGVQKSQAIMVRTMTEQEKSTEASYRVSWILNRHKMSFETSEVVKECMIEASKALFNDQKVTDTFQNVPLSNNSATRRTETLADDVRKTLIQKLRNAKDISICVDESTDNTDIAQLAVYVRFLDGELFREELLALIPMLGKTTGQDIFDKISGFFTDNEIPLNNVTSLVTDGAPAMLGINNGLAAKLKAVNPNLISYHCIIHNSVLCMKLKAKYEDTMGMIIKLVNFLRANSSLRHRQLKEFLQENEASYHDVPFHNAVRWLSKGTTLKVVWALIDDISSFLAALDPTATIQPYIEFLSDNEEMEVTAFLVDVFGHLNKLNKLLQGRQKFVADLRQEVRAFMAKLVLFRNDINSGQLLHFDTLREYRIKTESHRNLESEKKFIEDLIVEFDERFEGFNDSDDLLMMIKNPFIADPQGPWNGQVGKFCPNASLAGLQTDLIGVQADYELKHLHQSDTTDNFWIQLPPRFEHLKALGIRVCSMFGSTWLCESLFSHMNIAKNKSRSSLTHSHLDQILRIATTTFTPDFKKVTFAAQKHHFSH